MRALSVVAILCVFTLASGCRSLDSQGRIVNVAKRIPEGHPRGCAEFYMDAQCKDEAWVRHGWNSYPFGNRRADLPYSRGATSLILRIFAKPGPNVFRIGPTAFSNNEDFTITIRDQMVTPVRVSITRERAAMSSVDVTMTVTPEDPVPMAGRIDHSGRTIGACP